MNTKEMIAFEVIGLADGYCYPWEVEYYGMVHSIYS